MDQICDKVKGFVDKFQPLIEERTGTRLGTISVKPNKSLLRPLEFGAHLRLEWLSNGSPFKIFSFFDGYVMGTLDDFSGAYMSYYHSKKIIKVHTGRLRRDSIGDVILSQFVVHELSHALWDALEGTSEYTKEEKLFGEGFAMYGEKNWFADFIPERIEFDELYEDGMRKVEELVEKHGERILYRIPSCWKYLKV